MKKISSLMLLLSVAALAFAYPTRVYLVGASPTGWDMKGTVMYTNLTEELPNGTYEWVGDLNAGELKMLYGNDWVPSLGPAIDGDTLVIGSNAVTNRPDYEAADTKWTATAGRYHLTLNMTDMTLLVADATGEDALDGSAQEFLPENLYIVGSGCGAGWNAGGAYGLTCTEYGKFEGSFTLYPFNAEGGETYNEIKFLCQQDWGAHYGPAQDGEEVTGNGTYTIAKNPDGEDHKYHLQLTEEKEYTITIDLIAGEITFFDGMVTGVESQKSEVGSRKVMIDGQIRILNNGQLYDITGRKL